MAKNIFTLTEESIRTLGDVLSWWKRQTQNVAARPYVPPPVPQAPDVYVALTPSDGIPGMDLLGSGSGTGIGTESLPGYADCEIYCILETGRPGNNPIMYRLDNDGFTQRVYNLSTTRVPGGQYIVIERDKLGSWLTNIAPSPEPGSGSAVEPGYCQLASLQHSDCIGVYGPEGMVILSYSGAGSSGSTGVWTSTDTLGYPVLPGTGTTDGLVEFWFEGGSVHLSIGGKELLNCGDGCFTGGPLTGHEPPGTSTGSNQGPCQGETFTVCVQCIACPSSNHVPCECTSDPAQPGEPTLYEWPSTMVVRVAGGNMDGAIVDLEWFPTIPGSTNSWGYNGQSGWYGSTTATCLGTPYLLEVCLVCIDQRFFPQIGVMVGGIWDGNIVLESGWNCSPPAAQYQTSVGNLCYLNFFITQT